MIRGTEQQAGPVDLTVPASSEHLRILRLVAATLAAGLGLDVDQLDDLRIAVDELCSLLIEHAPGGCQLSITLFGQEGSLVVEGRLSEDAFIAPPDSVSKLILDGLDVGWSCAAPFPSFRLVTTGRQHRDDS